MWEYTYVMRKLKKHEKFLIGIAVFFLIYAAYTWYLVNFYG